MRKLLIILSIIATTQCAVFAQSKDERDIRNLDQLEIESIHKGDTATLLRLWSEKYVCNNPYGVIVTVPQIIGFIKAGEIDYSFTQRIVEKVTFNQNIAISMGHEIVKPQNNTPNAGKTIIMRYTHIWMETNGVWHLIARQATNFEVE